MKPTVTINLAGVVYHIDNDAYETLNAYLKDIEAHLEDSDSKKEIMQDIEARIAELFSMHMKYSHIEVVNSTMVADIMTQLGSPEMISSGTEESEGDSETGDSESPEGTNDDKKAAEQPKPYKKRFYRNIDNQIIGGVCSGFGEYIGIDALWIRLLMIVLFCLQGVGFIVYLLLWLIVPAANTAARRLEMRGIEPSAENIRAEVERVRDNVDANGNLKQQNNYGCLRTILIAGMAILCFPIAIAVFAIIFTLICAGFGIFMGGIGTAVGLSAVADILAVPQSLFVFAIIAAICGVLIVIIPIIVLFTWAIRRNRTGQGLKSGFWITSLVIWLIALFTLIAFNFRIGAEISKYEGYSFEEKAENYTTQMGIRLYKQIDPTVNISMYHNQVILNGDTISREEFIERTFGDGDFEDQIEQYAERYADSVAYQIDNAQSAGVLEITSESNN